MDKQYIPLYSQAAALQNKFHGYTRQTAYDPMAKVLRQQIHGLTNDIAMSKSPGVINSRLKTIQSQIRRAQTMNPGMNSPMNNVNNSAVNRFAVPSRATMAGQGPLLNNMQGSMLRSNFEKMRQNVMAHPNFK